jgi:hypothetical protein
MDLIRNHCNMVIWLEHAVIESFRPLPALSADAARPDDVGP